MEQTRAAAEVNLDRWGNPIQTKAASYTRARVPRVVGPRPPPLQSGTPARQEPVLASPKAVYCLPKWMTNFKDYEEELIAEFCPPSESSVSPGSASNTLAPDMSPAMGSESSESDYEFESCSDGSDCVLLGSESRAPVPGIWNGARGLKWPAPYQGYQMKEDEDVGLSAIVISPRVPVSDVW
jgi:hypothetical protein